MSSEDTIVYHSKRAREELDRGLTSDVMPAAQAHMKLASLHMQRVRELAAPDAAPRPLLAM